MQIYCLWLFTQFYLDIVKQRKCSIMLSLTVNIFMKL